MIEADDKKYTYNGLGYKVADSEGNYVLDITKPYHNILMKNKESYIWDESIYGENNYNYLCDELGSPIRYLDKEGQVLESYGYDEFGNKTKDRPQRFGFTGYEEDGHDRYYANARYYQPSTGRFMSRDKIKGSKLYPFTMNAYGYTYNNPLKYVDLDGNLPTILEYGADFVDDLEEGFEALGNASEYIVETGKDLYEDYAEPVLNEIYETGEDYFSSHNDPVSEFVENNLWDPAVELSHDVYQGSEYILNNVECITYNDMDMFTRLEAVNRLSLGMFKGGIYLAAEGLARLDGMEKLEELYDLLPEEVQATVDGSLEDIIYELNIVLDENITGEDMKEIAEEYEFIITYLLGMNYDEDTGYFYSSEGSSQQAMGYGDAFDKDAEYLGFDIFAQPIVFQYGDKEYSLEPWMGKYSPLATGGEIGLYSRPDKEAKNNPYDYHEENLDIFYQCAEEEDQLTFEFTVWDTSSDEKAEVCGYNTRDIDDGDENAYWMFCSNPFCNSDKDDLIMTATLEHEDEDFLKALLVEMVRVNKDPEFERAQFLYLKLEGNILTYTWHPIKESEKE